MSRKTFDDDKLSRGRFADFVKSLLINQQNYKRNTDSESFVMAIDSPWGTGKTYFIEMLTDYLEKQETPQFRAILYSAWKNDFWNNAFEPFMQAILSDEKFDDPTVLHEEKGKKLLKELVKCAPAIAKGIAFNSIKTLSGEDGTKQIDKAIEATSDYLFNTRELFPELNSFQENIKLLKSALNEYIELLGTECRFVIILDELDRCKPLFAIQTLEIVKHLFDVPNISFIFSLDIQQLSCSLKSVYGQDMDTVGYLMRFFDYISKMPLPPIDIYIEHIMANTGWLELSEQNAKSFTYHIAHTSANLNLSLRDIDTIWANFAVLAEYELKDIDDHMINASYFSLLCLKYKEPITYNTLFNLESSGSKANDEIMDKCNIKQLVPYIRNYAPLKRCKFKFPHLERPVSILGISNGVFNLAQLDIHGNVTAQIGNTIRWSKDVVLNGFISGKDLLDWEEIKEMSVSDFIKQKLELYNFIHLEKEVTRVF